MIDDVYHELCRMGLVSNSSDFSTVWLGRQESYYRGLRSKQRQPSIHVLVSCACRLRGAGDDLLAHGDHQHRASGRKLKRLAHSCLDQITSGMMT